MAAPQAHAAPPDLSSAPTQQWQRDALSALLILTLPSSIASSFIAPQCTLLDTRAC
ncbi:hypothetical protein [uncultured Corynebacterium sp.]|uniref:hypothetical protein n=1 Tax=uncultured Corynebacterium sp. TaxID=159447 RepID=UPI002592144F|nr:hypothetical protein [uncultured Corynebacterium sp.]